MATKHYQRNFTALEQRRKRAAYLLSKGVKQADIAREVGVSRQSVSVWAKELDVDQQAWRRKPLGSQLGFGQAQRRWLGTLLQRGGRGERFRQQCLDAKTHCSTD